MLVFHFEAQYAGREGHGPTRSILPYRHTFKSFEKIAILMLRCQQPPFIPGLLSSLKLPQVAADVDNEPPCKTF
jgi:hypothetical protein